MTEARIAGAGVVDRESHAPGVPWRENIGELDVIADRRVLGQFEHHPVQDGADTEALAFMMGMAAADVNASETSTARQILQDMQNNCMFNINVIAGSPATVARKVDEIAAIPGVAGMMFTFPDFVEGVERFGTEVMPLLVCNK